mmetsp:Transcript_62743/g.111457  ORF Transcript_62743/g.111457 Transcript_62743/m.111457 type:complete len:241 (+) Transcript_62743:673-1395(+)
MPPMPLPAPMPQPLQGMPLLAPMPQPPMPLPAPMPMAGIMPLVAGMPLLAPMPQPPIPAPMHPPMAPMFPGMAPMPCPLVAPPMQPPGYPAAPPPPHPALEEELLWKASHWSAGPEGLKAPGAELGTAEPAVGPPNGSKAGCGAACCGTTGSSMLSKSASPPPVARADAAWFEGWLAGGTSITAGPILVPGAAKRGTNPPASFSLGLDCLGSSLSRLASRRSLSRLGSLLRNSSLRSLSA